MPQSPSTLAQRIALTLGLMLAVVGLFTTVYFLGHRHGTAAGKSRLDLEHALRLAESTRADTAYRTLELTLAATQEEIHVQAEKDRASVAAAGPGLHDAGRRLRIATAATAARCGAPADDPAPAGISTAASSPGDLLADVQRRLDEAAADVVRFADAAAIAAGECAADYDAARATLIQAAQP